jgi:uncharacterized protein (DUF1330 family)
VTVYAIAQLRFTDRAADDRYQSISKDREAGADSMMLLVRGLA